MRVERRENAVSNQLSCALSALNAVALATNPLPEIRIADPNRLDDKRPFNH